ncbi:hypothetical protein OE88DRAFT_939551 [Heliocybe sulcata]|uniref:Uncharacterized protein n=1 Tax=Heliocybe sulcata TaxID=5364 RepID=A0A5C3N9Z3_9AGAM|nr:hypothetical protein OE88DRAFT_939551 [Heliocybe sulcata]
MAFPDGTRLSRSYSTALQDYRMSALRRHCETRQQAALGSKPCDLYRLLLYGYRLLNHIAPSSISFASSRSINQKAKGTLSHSRPVMTDGHGSALLKGSALCTSLGGATVCEDPSYVQRRLSRTGKILVNPLSFKWAPPATYSITLRLSCEIPIGTAPFRGELGRSPLRRVHCRRSFGSTLRCV